MEQHKLTYTTLLPLRATNQDANPQQDLDGYQDLNRCRKGYSHYLVTACLNNEAKQAAAALQVQCSLLGMYCSFLLRLGQPSISDAGMAH